MQKKRPKHLNLIQIRLPLPGIVSILHRVSGALLFVSLPLLLWVLQQSLQSAEQFNTYREWLAHPLFKLFLLGLIWAYLHHFCAGIRFLLLDMHIGTSLPAARQSSYAVLLISLLFTAILGVQLW
jgi:succinate dehydrogenase / fumarate reductase cytochrome b subunit